MAILPKGIYILPWKSQWHSSQTLKKINPKVHLEAQKTVNSQGNTEKKEQCWSYHNAWLQTILQSNNNKNSMILAQNQTRKLVKQKRIPRYESIQPHPPDFWQWCKNIQWRKDSFFNKCCWENWIPSCRKLKLDSCLSPCISINSKWIKDLKIRPETLKLVQERAGSILELIGIGNDFLNRTQMAQQLWERIDEWDYINKKLLHNKRNVL
jgi:hypothetical protein